MKINCFKQTKHFVFTGCVTAGSVHNGESSSDIGVGTIMVNRFFKVYFNDNKWKMQNILIMFFIIYSISTLSASQYNQEKNLERSA